MAADDGLDWMFRLFDQMSGPARSMLGALKTLQGGLRGLQSGLNATSSAFASFGRGVREAISVGAGLGGWVSAISAIKGILSTPFDWAKQAIDSLAFKESTLKSFELILGTRQEAQGMFQKAFDFARITPFETEDVVKSFQHLLAAGFNKVEVPIVFQALGDVSSLSGGGAEAISAITTQIAQVRGRGKLQEEDLKPIVNWTAAAGVSQDKVFAHIAKNLGVAKSAVADLMKAGKISADVGIFSLLEAIKEGPSSGMFGRGMLAQAFTIKGLLSNVSSAYGDFWKAMGEDSLPGLDIFKHALQNLANALDPTSGTGKQIMGALRGAFNDLFTGLFDRYAGSSGADNMAKDIGRVINAFKWLWEIGKGVLLFFRNFFLELFGASGISKLSDAFDPASAKAFSDTLANAGSALGKTLGDMLSNLMKGGEWDSAGQRIGESVGAGIRTGLTKGIGESLFYTLTGAKQGSWADTAYQFYANKNGREKTDPAMGLSPTPNLPAEPAAAPPSALGAGGTRLPAKVDVHLNIDNKGHDDGEAIGRKLQEMLPSALSSAFDSMAIEGGLA